MSIRGIKRNFSGGEVAPTINSRDDLAKYASACRHMKNFIAQVHGGARYRGGFEYIATALGAARMIPFEFNTDEEDIYVMVFTDQKMRLIQGEGYVLDGTPVEVVTPYLEAELAELEIGVAQLGDVVYIAHPNHALRKLVRTSHTAWTLTTVAFVSGVDAPASGITYWVGTSASVEYPQRYKVSTVDDSGEESLPTDFFAEDLAATASSWVADNALKVGWFPVPGAREYNIYKEANGVYGLVGVSATEMGEFDLSVYEWIAAANDEYLLRDIGYTWNYMNFMPKPEAMYDDGVLMTEVAYSNAGSLNPGEWAYEINSAFITVDIYHIMVKLFATGVTPDDRITIKAAPPFIDHNYIPEAEVTPLIANNPFEDDNHPSVAVFHQQRLWLAGSDDNPFSFYASRTGNFESFAKSRPTKDDDSLEFTISGDINQIRWMVSFGDLMLGTTGAEHKVTGADSDAITSTSVQSKVQSAWGSRALVPIIVGSSILQVQRQGTTVRDLFYSLEKDGYAGNNLSVLARHLFDGHTLESWAYQQEPDSVLWGVRSDGKLLGMTYLKEHEIWGWHVHETENGLFEDVCVVGSGGNDVLYAVVKRVIDGSTVRYIEKLSEKWHAAEGIDDAIYLDSCLSYNGWNTVAADIMTLTGGTLWIAGEDITLTASGSGHAPFSAPMVGRKYRLKDDSDAEVDVLIIGYTSTTVVTVQGLSDVPLGLQAAAADEWALLANVLSGLSHLEGEEVSALADGSPAGGLTVTSGEVTLPAAMHVAKAHVGLPYTGSLAPLPFELVTKAGTSQGYPRGFGLIYLRLHESVGGHIGAADVNIDLDDVVFDTVNQAPPQWGVAIQPFTGVRVLPSPGGVEDELAVYVKQDQPLPFEVLSIIADVEFG